MPRNYIKASLLVIIFCLLCIEAILAQSKTTITASYKYTLGDNDTKSDAKKLAFIEAKRLCLEKRVATLKAKQKFLSSG